MLWLRVTLTKVPSKYLEIQATDRRICVSTPGWSKNFHLESVFTSFPSVCLKLRLAVQR